MVYAVRTAAAAAGHWLVSDVIITRWTGQCVETKHRWRHCSLLLLLLLLVRLNAAVTVQSSTTLSNCSPSITLSVYTLHNWPSRIHYALHCPRETSELLWWVCLSARITRKPSGRTSPNFLCTLTTASISTISCLNCNCISCVLHDRGRSLLSKIVLFVISRPIVPSSVSLDSHSNERPSSSITGSEFHLQQADSC